MSTVPLLARLLEYVEKKGSVVCALEVAVDDSASEGEEVMSSSPRSGETSFKTPTS